MLKRIEAKFSKFSQAFFYFLVWMTKYLMFCLFINIRVVGKENIPKKGRYILAANHKNFFDGFFVAYATGPFKKISFVIAKRALKPKSFQLLAKLIDSVVLGNEAEEYQRALKKLNRILSHGAPIGIFPEGDVSKSNIPRKFKGGVAKLSLDSKTKVIPIYISGSYNLRYLRYWLKRPEILVKIGKPIDLYNYATDLGNNLEQMAAFLREKILELGGINENENLKSIDSYSSNTLVNMYKTASRKTLGKVH